MKRLLNLFLFLLFAACAKVESTAIPVVVSTEAIPTSTPIPPTALPSFTPTTEPPCDPFTTDFCISDGHFLLQRPIHPPARDALDPTYRYGSTANGTREPHHGVEFPNSSGTPVYAAAEGTILFAGPDSTATYSPWPNFYGNLVVIAHKDGLFTLYAHLSMVNVNAGQMVGTGTKIGEVGSTGVAIGSHLHFEVRRGDVENYFATQNPELWLVPLIDSNGAHFGVLVISIVTSDHHLVNYAEYTVQQYLDKSRKPVKSYYGATYSADMLSGGENAVLGDLPPGQYRIAIERNGAISERWVEVESGRLTQVVFVVK
jgi:murein DD-endopeptidase MepM/ murein hydrolase activator NlpD